MLTIICGEDVITSRNYLSTLKKQYVLKGYELMDVDYSGIDKILLYLAESPSLFSQKKIFISQRLNKHVKKENQKLISTLEKIDKMKDVELIDWEEVSAWELKLKKIGHIKEFKASQTIFKLLESLYPGNRILFISLLDRLVHDLDENFIFIMLVRYVRNLILVKEGITPPKIQSWQVYKLKNQAKHWKLENLVNFYEALFKIEVGIKTSSNPFNIKESLDILACHFL